MGLGAGAGVRPALILRSCHSVLFAVIVRCWLVVPVETEKIKNGERTKLSHLFPTDRERT